jgi:hypothetical protein
MNSTDPVVQRTPASHAAAHARRSWLPLAAVIILNGALAAFVHFFTENEDRYSAFVSAFALWFALPCAAGSVVLALLALWRDNKLIAILGIAYHGAALVVLAVWTFGWSFAGLWAQSERGYLVGLTLQVAASLLLVLVMQAAAYIYALVRSYDRDREAAQSG